MICGLTKDAVAFCRDAVTKEDALHRVIDLACSTFEISSPDEITASIMKRENKLSTGIGLEVALPHCWSDIVKTRISAVLFIPSGIEYNSVDHLPVKLIFLVVSPTDDVQGHIACLSSIAHVVSDEEIRRKVIRAASPDELFGLLNSDQS